MVRKYKRAPGSRQYGDYAPEVLEEALEMIRSKQLSQREASQQYNIPRSTLKLKLKGLNDKTVGRQTVLAAEEEQLFVDHIIAVSEYGFPVSSFDLRCLVKFYLDKNKRKEQRFKDNMPGEDWAILFLRRHKTLSSRTAANIKSNRANVSPEILNKYFDNLEKTLQDIPSANIWNYDETNLVDDPGQKKVLVKRGCKYPERIMNSAKSANSVMFCGNADGELLPPYTVYKAENMWDSWTQGGYPNARYNRSKSGWFDQCSFEDWFFSLALPRLKKQDGKKALIGDNLSSHLSLSVIEACKKHDISFVALPANSTHLTQPLDVAFFRPMKAAWRTILTDWKVKHGDKPVGKDVFPRLLKGMLTKIGMENNHSLQAGFMKCGISPLNRNKVLDRIPKNVKDSTEENVASNILSPASSLNSPDSSVTSSFLQFLSESRYSSDNNTPLAPGKKKVSVDPGKSISEMEVREQKQAIKRKLKKKKSAEPEADSENVAPKKRVKKGRTQGSKEKTKKRKSVEPEIDTENAPKPRVPKRRMIIESDTDNEPDDPTECENISNSDGSDDELDKDVDFEIGSYVIVEYEMEYFPGCVVNVDVDGSAEVKVMVTLRQKTTEDTVNFFTVLLRTSNHSDLRLLTTEGYRHFSERLSVWCQLDSLLF